MGEKQVGLCQAPGYAKGFVENVIDDVVLGYLRRRARLLGLEAWFWVTVGFI